jgi:SNF2 family DNA or RNA helicase
MEPFYIARPQSIMNPEIEKPLFIPRLVQLLPKQRRAYNEMKEESIAWIGEHEDEPLWALVAVAKLTRLRQLCTAYATFTHIPHEDRFDETLVTLSEPSTKLDAVMDKLEEIGNHQVIIGSQFAQTIDLATERFRKAKISYSRLTGDITSDKVRSDEIDKFVKGDTRVYISTIEAGGIGVDGLQYATNLGIRIDRSWSPAKNKQWIGRIKRDGQKLRPIIYDIEAEDTVDQEVEEKLILKAKWIFKMLGKEI